MIFTIAALLIWGSFAVFRRELQGVFPEREIVQIPIDGIAAGGGGIHCTTQQEPKIRTNKV